MKKFPSFFLGVCVCALVFGALTWKLSTSSGFTTTEEYRQQIRNGLAEVALPTSNGPAAVTASVDSLSNFMSYRSGVQLSSANKASLQSTHISAVSNSKMVNAEELAQIISDITIERIPNLSNSEITGITDSMRGFMAPGLPSSFQQDRIHVTLRARGYGRMEASKFSDELTSLRDGGIESGIAQNLISTSLATEVNLRVNTLKDAEPQFFGGTASDMTPLQALLVAYSAIADDSLAGNQAALTQRMQTAHAYAVQVTGGFPSPAGHKAYGDNGYLHCSPTSIMLSNASVARLITLIQERGN